MRDFESFHDHRLWAGLILLFLCVSFPVLLHFQNLSSSGFDNQIVTGEDCVVSEKFDFDFGSLDYYSGNGTVRMEINSTENLTSGCLKNISLTGFSGNGSESNPVIRSANRTSRTGVIATTEDSENAVEEFPLEPVNITVLGLAEDKEDRSLSRLESGDQIQLRYYQQYVSVEGFCRPYKNIALFKIGEKELERMAYAR